MRRTNRHALELALAFWAIAGGALLVFGGLIGTGLDRMTLRAFNEKRLLTVIVGLPDADDRYRWLSVRGCSASLSDSGAFCTGDFERESSMEITAWKQHLISWRDLPGGTMLITAMVFDANRRVLARDTIVIFRSR